MTLEEIKPEFETLLEDADRQRLKAFLDEQNISDIANLVYEYPDEETRIIVSMSVHRAAGVFRILEVPTQQRILKSMPPNKIAELLNELPPDDRTAFLEELPSSGVRELIKLLNPEERKITLSLLGYPENSVGRLMTPDYVYVYENNTVKEVLDVIRRVGKNSETIDVIYVINERGELIDDIRIREFILNPPEKKVSELMDNRVIALNAFDDQEVANDAFKMNNRVALPVVSNTNKLLGIVTIDDILWMASEEFGEDIQMIGGTAALDQPYLEMPLFALYKRRIIWLFILFIGGLMTISAMHHFEDMIARVTMLASFIPIIIASGGNSGSQAATLIIQAMALGEISLRDWWRIIRREIFSGLMLGTTLGLMGVILIFIWHFISDAFGVYWLSIALTIFLSIVGVVLWGTLIGSMLPLILKRLGADPAASSTPFVATLVDVTGLVIYFSVALAVLSGKLL